MLLPSLGRADLIGVGATPATGALTRVLAEPMAPPTPGGYRLRCWAPPANASFDAPTPRSPMLCKCGWDLARCCTFTIYEISGRGVMAVSYTHLTLPTKA